MSFVLRPSSSHMNELILVFQKLPVQIFLHERQHPLQESVQRRLRGADRGDSESRPLQQVPVPDPGARHFQFGTNPRLETSHDHPLFLQAAASRQMEVEDGVSNDHGVTLTARAASYRMSAWEKSSYG